MEIGSLFICFDSYQAKQDFSQLINSLSWAIFGVQLPAMKCRRSKQSMLDVTTKDATLLVPKKVIIILPQQKIKINKKS